jgi:hypothetical protein
MRISVTRPIYDALAQASCFTRGVSYKPGDWVHPGHIANLLGVCFLTVQNWEAACDGPAWRAVTPNEPAQSKIANLVVQFPNYEAHALRAIKNPEFWAGINRKQTNQILLAMQQGDTLRLENERLATIAAVRAEVERIAKVKADALNAIQEHAKAIQLLTIVVGMNP